LQAVRDASKKLTFKELAGKLHETGGTIIGPGPASIPRGPGGSFATHIVDVEVDPDHRQGEDPTLHRDARLRPGGASPATSKARFRGGVVQGIGWGLNEEYVYNDKGEMTNASFLDYRMPTSLDLPMIESRDRGSAETRIIPSVSAVSAEVPIVPPPARPPPTRSTAPSASASRDLPMSPPAGDACVAGKEVTFKRRFDAMKASLWVKLYPKNS